MGCRTTAVDPAVRAKILSQGHPLYLPALEYQVRHHLKAYHSKTIAVKVPKSEKPEAYVRALSTLFPTTTFLPATETASESVPMAEAIGIRRTGALVGEVFGAVTVGESRNTYLYYLKIGKPLPGQPHHWWIAKEEPWPADVPPPIRQY